MSFHSILFPEPGSAVRQEDPECFHDLMRAFREHLPAPVESAAFNKLAAETRKLAADLSAIRYCLHTDVNLVTVRLCQGKAECSTAVEDTFRKFRQGAVTDYRAKFDDRVGMNHILSFFQTLRRELAL